MKRGDITKKREIVKTKYRYIDISRSRDHEIGSQLPVDIRKLATILFRSFLIGFKCEV